MCWIHGLSLTILSMRLRTFNSFSYLQQELLTSVWYGLTPASPAVSALAGLLCIPRAPFDRLASQRDGQSWKELYD